VYSLRVVNVARNWMHTGRSNSSGLAAAGDGDAQVSPEVKPKLDERSGYASYHRDPAWHEEVAAQFEESIRAMVQMCRMAGVPMLLVEPGCNLRDCPPLKSDHRATLSAAEEIRWQSAFDAAAGAEEGELTRALSMYRQAEAID